MIGDAGPDIRPLQVRAFHRMVPLQDDGGPEEETEMSRILKRNSSLSSTYSLHRTSFFGLWDPSHNIAFMAIQPIKNYSGDFR